MILPNFDGEKKSFHFWWIRFKAFSIVARITVATGRKADDKLPAKVEVDANDTDEQKNTKKENVVAMSYPNMSMTTEDCMVILSRVFTSD